MKAAFLEKPGEIYLKEVDIPVFDDHEVLINIKETGICGSDLHYYKEGRVGANVIREPHILGHESAGIVVETGKNVTHLKPGDRVTIEPGLPCLSCEFCLQGRYNLCVDVHFMGAPPYPGTFREYIAHDSRFVYKLPDHVSYTQGALAEPFAVAYNCLMSANIFPGMNLHIIGAGPIGLACLEMAPVFGITKIFISDIDPYRLDCAKKMGATEAINGAIEDPVAVLTEATGGRLCDSVIEASGSEKGYEIAVHTLKKGGTVAVVGMGKETVPIPATMMIRKEATVKGVYRYVNHYKPVIELLSAGKINGENWISHRFKLEEIEKAMVVANDKNENKLKMVVTI